MPEFDEASARRIARVVKRVELMPRNQIGRRQPPTIIPFSKVGITTTAITARSGKTPGGGSVQPYLYDIDTNTLAIFGDVEGIKNWTGSTVAANIWIKYTVIDGKLFLDGTDCSGAAP